MGRVAAGTVGGALRSTAAHRNGRAGRSGSRPALLRFVVVVAAFMVASSAMLAAPAAVWAADNFSRDVKFPKQTKIGGRVLFDLYPGQCYSGTPASGGVGPTAPGALTGTADPTPEVRYWTSTPGTGNGIYCADETENPSEYWSWTNEDVAPTTNGCCTQYAGALHVELEFSTSSTTGGRIFHIVWTTCQSGVGCGATSLQDDSWAGIPTSQCGSAIDAPACRVFVDAYVTPPAGAVAFRITTTSGGGTSNAIRLYKLRLTAETGATVGGDCTGSGGLAWGASGLSATRHTSWGDAFMGSFVVGGCRFDRSDTYSYTPPEGMDEGDTWAIGVAVASVQGRTCTVEMSWATTGGTVPIFASTYSGSNLDGALGPGAFIVKEDVPAGATAVRWFLGGHCIIQLAYVANVEGDPIQDTPCSTDDPCIGPGTPGGEGIFEDCDAPANALDVPGWLAFGACVVVAGFTNTLAAIWSIPGAVVNGELGDLSPLGELFGDAIAGLGDIFGGVIEALFLPSELGDSWSGFWDELTDRVPFGWVSQGYDALASVSSASGAAMSWTFTIDDVEVPVPFGGLVAAAAPYRGWLAAVVVAGTVLAVWRSVSGSGAEGQMSLGL